jgi:hypothetical protein
MPRLETPCEHWHTNTDSEPYPSSDHAPDHHNNSDPFLDPLANSDSGFQEEIQEFPHLSFDNAILGCRPLIMDTSMLRTQMNGFK